MSYVFGPVPSRRLGLSLGVDPLPYKTCNLDCIYCELGRTQRLTAQRKTYVPVDAVLADVREALKTCARVDYVTVTGSGEPTLHSGLGAILRGIKAMTEIPLAVITHSSLLHLPEVRADLAAADLLIPSLDAVSQKIFRRLNHPHSSVSPERMVEGLVALRQEYSGPIWLEILIVKDLNDGPEEVGRLREAVRRIRPDRVQLNTVARPPAYPFAEPLSRETLEALRESFGEGAEVIAEFPSQVQPEAPSDPERAIRTYLERRPATLFDLISALGLKAETAEGHLRALVEEGEVEQMGAADSTFYSTYYRFRRQKVQT